MSRDLINLIGFSAAALTTFSFVPQFIKLIKTRKTEGLSVVMMLQISAGLILWLIYGILRKDIVIITANAAGLIIVVATVVAYFIIRSGNAT